MQVVSIGVHNENDETVKTLIARHLAAGKTDYLAHNTSRPIYAENLAVNEVYELGADTGCSAHIVHCSNGRGYDICANYQRQGFDATIEGCLHYFLLCKEDDVSRLHGKAKVNPPIRSKVEREKLWQHLASGKVTAVSTDHVSWSLDRKDKANIFDNASGAAGLPLMIDGALSRGVALSRIAQVLAYNPARLFRLNGKKRRA